MKIEQHIDRLIKIYKLSKKAFFNYKKQIVILILFGFLSGLLEGVGINALIPLFSFILEKGGQANDAISQMIRGLFDLFHISFRVRYLLMFIIILFVLKSAVAFFLSYLRAMITSDYELTTRKKIFQRVIEAKWPFFIKNKSGYLETVILVDVPLSSSLLNQISMLLISATSLIVYLIIAFNISFYITLLTLFFGGVFFFITRNFVRKTKSLSYKRMRINKEMTHQISENINGIKTVKTIVAENGVLQKIESLFANVRSLVLKINIYNGLTSSFIQPISLIYVCILFSFAYTYGSIDFASLVAIVYLINKIFAFIQDIQQKLNNVNENYPHLRSVLDFKDLVSNEKEQNLGQKDFLFNDRINFNNVDYYYEPGKYVLKDFSFEIKKGEMVGLVGTSGTGKTTLVDLILRLFKIESGSITVDGLDIDQIDLYKWRQKIGYVSQDIFLTNDSIENNIKFYDDSITEEKMIKAAKMADIYDFIINSKDGFKTVIGEKGAMISAGQRQRISIARILARDPEILILDEATSALDNESEVRIQNVIKNLRGKITVLAIAHRLSTLIDFDKLIVLEKGKIKEQGRPSELLKDTQSYFYKVYNIRE